VSPEDPLIEVIADAIVDADTLTGDQMPAARAVYAAIAATGRLLNAGVVVVATTEAAAGFAERFEWATQSVWADGLPRIIRRCRGEDEARAMQAAPLTGEMLGRNVLRRTVYTGPWEVAQ
jgi:hypothetical protein